MLDYSICGIFGDVRFWNTCVPSGTFSSLDHISHIGWHRVNERYRIDRPNGAGHNMMILTLSGQGHIQIAGRKYTATAGTVAVIPRNTAHIYHGIAGELWEFHWIHYFGDASQGSTSDLTKNGEYLFEPGIQKIRNLFRILTDPNHQGILRELAESDALNRMLHHLLRAYAASQMTSLEPHGHLVPEMVRLLEGSTHSDFSLDLLVDTLHYSKEHMIRQFKSAMGMTPYRYWRSIRFRQICSVLESTDLPVNKISEDFGFSSVSSFSRQFREFAEVTPSEYRKNYGFYQN